MATFFHACSDLGNFLSLTICRPPFIKPLSTFPESSHGCWDEISGDLLHAIAGKISLSDQIRLGLVCKSWRLLQNRYVFATVYELPRLVLPRDPNCSHMHWFNLSRGEVENFKLPVSLRGGYYIGSSNGWLAFSKAGFSLSEALLNINAIFVLLFNPISGAILHLPSIYSNSSPRTCPISHISNITVSSSKVSESLRVAAIFDDGRELAAWKRGDKKWETFVRKDLHKVRYKLVDISFHRELLLALTVEAPAEKPESIHDVIRPLPNHHYNYNYSYLGTKTDGVKVVFIHKIDNMLVQSGDRTTFASSYLTSSIPEDEVLLITRYYRPKQNVDTQNTKGFIILKLNFHQDSISYSWVPDIGGQALFLGKVGSHSLRTKNMDGFRRNCIFFTDSPSVFEKEASPSSLRETGLCDLDNNKFEDLCISETDQYPSGMDWFSPTSCDYWV